MKQFLKYTLATLCGLLLFSVINFFFFFALLGSIAALGTSGSVTKAKPHSVYVVDTYGSMFPEDLARIMPISCGMLAVEIYIRSICSLS